MKTAISLVEFTFKKYGTMGSPNGCKDHYVVDDIKRGLCNGNRMVVCNRGITISTLCADLA